ncbi:MAG: NupC/NupG family nucleoside CNT transporter [Candidatus Latescibacteria bacterium]|jgi:concentrative nucleoside transporter, CNT family|nr:NupC/NupG family nucleoside CNT transporter [Candidatus Latescibacterota bacterium]
MDRLISFFGLLAMLFLAWLLSTNRRKMNVRLIISGIALQLVLAVVLLKTGPGQAAFVWARIVVDRVVGFSNDGSRFLFGGLVDMAPVGFSILPMVIFVSSITGVLFYLGILQWIVRLMARVMVYVMNTSGSESLAASANVYLGISTAPLVIVPYLRSMTGSEIMALMTTGMATVAGSVLAAYVTFGVDAGHLMAASLMSAPAALVISKIMVPETESSPTMGVVKVDIPRLDANVLDAACRGASDGMRLALNIAAMLIIAIAFVSLFNWIVGQVVLNGSALSLERVLGWLGAPLAWLMGVPWAEAPQVGMLIGKKTILNEFLAYQDLGQLRSQLSDRSFIIATYALCSFANFGSIAVMIGGIGGLVPERRKDIARFGIRSMIGGALAANMTATIAGILI